MTQPSARRPRGPDAPRVRAGLVGAGHMGRFHALVYAELWDVDFAVVADTALDRAETLAREYGCLAVGDHRQLIGRVDVASVAVPTEHHAAVARDLLEAGIAVLVEKPIAPTLAEAEALFGVARRVGSILQVGHVERFNGAVQELRKIVQDPLLLESRRLGPFAPRVQADSVVRDLMIHDLDIVLALVDSPVRYVAAAGLPVRSEAFDIATVQLGFASGAIAVLTASRATEEKIRTLAITQRDAYIVLDYLDQGIQVHRRATQEATLQPDTIRYRQESLVEHLYVHRGNPLKLELQHLVASFRRRGRGEAVELAEVEDLRSLAMVLDIEDRMRHEWGTAALGA